MKIVSIVSLIVSVLCALCLVCCIPAYYNFYGFAAVGYKWIEVLFAYLLCVFCLVEVFMRLCNREVARLFLFWMAFISLVIALSWIFALLIIVIGLSCTEYLRARLDPNGIFPVAVGVIFVIWFLSFSLRCMLRARILAQEEVVIRKEESFCGFPKKLDKCNEESRARNNPCVGTIFCFMLFFVLLSYSPLLAIVGGIAAIIKLSLMLFSRRRKPVNVSSKISSKRITLCSCDSMDSGAVEKGCR